jgi:two-component system chemotaxis sensor kinase CheA
VDDEPSIVGVVETIVLSAVSAPVRTFTDPREALTAALESAPLLVITDLRMPHMTGIDLSRQIKARHPDCPCVLLTGFADKESSIEAIRLGINDILEKPFKEAAITTAAERYFGAWQKRRETELAELTSLRETFLEEAREILDGLDNAFLSLEHEGSPTLVNALFRSLHTLKGSSGSVPEATNIQKTAHAMENVLSRLKANDLVITSEDVTTLLGGLDMLRAMVKAEDLGRSFEERLAPLWNNLRQISDRPKETRVGATATLTATRVGEGPAAEEDQDDGVFVPMARLNSLMESAGELISFKNSLASDQGEGNAAARRTEQIQTFTKLNDRLHSEIMEMRKVRADRVFSRLPRLIRQVALDLKKDIQLQIEGSDLKLDKTIASALSQSLVHLLRNSCDHGIETVETRAKEGKPAKGTIAVRAFRQGETIHVSIEDDGQGLRRDKIVAKAIKTGMITEDEAKTLSDERVHALLFRSGFSTSEKVTAVSGRGVGLDAVQTAVESVGGHIRVESRAGQGTKFLMTLPEPRTVTVEPSLLVEYGAGLFSIPLSGILEILSHSPERVVHVSHRPTLPYREQTLMIGSIDEYLGQTSETWKDGQRGDFIIVLHHKAKTIGLRANRVIGQLDAVIKPFNGALPPAPGFRGIVAIGDTRMAYGLAPEVFVEMALKR